MKNTLIILLLFSLLGCASTGHYENDEVACKIIKAGILEGDLKKEYEVEGRTSDYHRSYSALKVIEETLKIPLVKNIHFGVEHTFTGLDKDGEVTEVVTHPLIIKPNGDSSIGYKRNKNPGSFSGYILNRDYELVSGLWTLDYFYKGKKLCGASFEVHE